MNPTTVNVILGAIGIASQVLRLVGQTKGWTGGEKLARELEAVAAAATEAFKNDPVLKADIEAGRHGHVW